MRIILTILGSIAFFSLQAQTDLSAGQQGFQPARPISNYSQSTGSNLLGPKWRLTPYAGISAGSIFYAGGAAYFPGGTSYLSVPIGLQLSRSLNNNLYAFAGISAAPTVFSVNQLTATHGSLVYPGFNNPKLGLSSRVEAGLMYVNDARTFSISGSIGVERYSYPVYPSPPPAIRKQ